MIFRRKQVLPLGMTDDDLPTWMRKTRREVDWAFLVMIVLCLVVVWPFMARSGLPHNPGTQIEIGRAIEMAESIQTGILYPRWAADFNYGYGSPLWNYLAPLPHYLTGLHLVLAQTNPETSVKFGFAAAVFLGGMGLFSFARRRWGTYAGLLAAAVYIYSPQYVLVKPYLESDLSSLLAFSVFPVALWAFDRVLVIGRGWDVTLAAITLAALWLTHTPLNLILAGVLLGWLAWCSAVRQSSLGKRHVAVSFVLGTLLSAFYWVPAWIERTAVHWHAITDQSLHEWTSLSPGEILGYPAQLDLSALNPVQTNAVGIAVWGLALLAIALMVSMSWRHTPAIKRTVTRGEVWQIRLMHLVSTMPPAYREAGYFVLVGIGAFVLMMPFAFPLWNYLPSWPSLYPHDFLLLVGICGALVAAQIGAWEEQIRRPVVGGLGLFVCLAGVLGLAWPTLYPPPWPEKRATADLSTLVGDEVRGYTLASHMMTGQLLPKAVTELPRPSSTLIASYQSETIDKVARELLPHAVQVDVIEHKPQSERLVVYSSYAADLTLLVFDFPGWRVQINGERVPVKPASQTGLLAFSVPEGRHEILVRFGSTPARDFAWSVSAITFLVSVIISVRLEYGPRRTLPGEVGWPTLDTFQRLVLLGTVLLFGIGGALPRLAPELFTYRSPPGIVETAQAQLPRTLQGGIDLLAYTIEPAHSIRPEDELTVTLYWRVFRPDVPDYQVNVAIEGNTTPPIVFVRHRHPGMIPSSQWTLWPLLDYYVRDVYYLAIGEDVAVGEYNVVIQVGPCNQFGMLACETIDPLFVRDGRGESLGRRIMLPHPIWIQP